MRMPVWFVRIWWGMLVLATTAFLWYRMPCLAEGRAMTFDMLVLPTWLALVLCPLFSEISIFGLRLKREVEAMKVELKQDIRNLTNVVRSNTNVVVQQGTQPLPSDGPEKTSEETPLPGMKLKILNTLWTHHVNRFEDLSHVWTFRLNANAAEFLDFRDAATDLMREGLVSETGHGQIHLTTMGLDYCKKHYEEFPDNKWWPDVSIDPERLKLVLRQP